MANGEGGKMRQNASISDGSKRRREVRGQIEPAPRGSKTAPKLIRLAGPDAREDLPEDGRRRSKFGVMKTTENDGRGVMKTPEIDGNRRKAIENDGKRSKLRTTENNGKRRKWQKTRWLKWPPKK